MWCSCELRNWNRCDTWWRRRTSSPTTTRALSFENSVGRARKRDRWQVCGNERTFPPTALTWLSEVVSIPIRANKFWRRVGERVVGQQPNNSPVALEQSLDKREKPWVQVRRRHGGEPHLPVKLPMVRRDDARRPVHVPRFSLEFVFAPLSGSIRKFCISAFDDDFEPFARDRAECAVGVHQMQVIEAGVHQLPT